MRQIGIFTLCFFATACFSLASAEAARLLSIRHAEHADSGFDRVVFDLDGKARLLIHDKRAKRNVLFLTLEGARVGPDGIFCKTTGRKSSYPPIRHNNSFACLTKGKLIYGVEFREVPDERVLIAIIFRRTLARELAYRARHNASHKKVNGKTLAEHYWIDLAQEKNRHHWSPISEDPGHQIGR